MAIDLPRKECCPQLSIARLPDPGIFVMQAAQHDLREQAPRQCDVGVLALGWRRDCVRNNGGNRAVMPYMAGSRRANTCFWGRVTCAYGRSIGRQKSEKIHEYDFAYIQVVRSDGAGVHGGDPAELRVDGRRWDEIWSVRPDSYRAKCLNVTPAAARSSHGP